MRLSGILPNDLHRAGGLTPNTPHFMILFTYNNQSCSNYVYTQVLNLHLTSESYSSTYNELITLTWTRRPGCINGRQYFG